MSSIQSLSYKWYIWLLYRLIFVESRIQPHFVIHWYICKHIFQFLGSVSVFPTPTTGIVLLYYLRNQVPCPVKFTTLCFGFFFLMASLWCFWTCFSFLCISFKLVVRSRVDQSPFQFMEGIRLLHRFVFFII